MCKSKDPQNNNQTSCEIRYGHWGLCWFGFPPLCYK